MDRQKRREMAATTMRMRSGPAGLATNTAIRIGPLRVPSSSASQLGGVAVGRERGRCNEARSGLPCAHRFSRRDPAVPRPPTRPSGCRRR
uniref:Uncharacterized protein n=1 Tax=Plectus sambesii TaxID=2011161 RepID=A0A914UK83_9BILA